MRISRPGVPPGYGIAADLPEPIPPWADVEAKLEASRNYWICTASPDGKPQAMPVWGLYFDQAVLFNTDPESRKGRNIAANPRATIHLESGDDVVILEGVLETVPATTLPAAVFDAYEAKYRFRPDATETGDPWYRLQLQKAFTWGEQDFPNSALRWQP